MSNEAEWNDHFNIGVDSIDNAHRKLFSIVRRLIRLSRDENNGQWACAEGIKYFKSYAIEHFTDEEAYMQSIGYESYEVHKRLHDDMRYKTLPALEADLTESDYSQESIHHFLGICLGWLTAHIMIEDRAITGRVSNKWKKDNAGRELALRIAEQLGIHCGMSSLYQLESSHFMTAEQFRKTFYLEIFDYSLLFNTGRGYFAFCIKSQETS